MIPVIIQSIAIAFLGWGIGIFINYLADVLPYSRKLAKPFCLSCQHVITTQINPLYKFFVWPKTCPNCKCRRPIRTFFVELILVILAIITWLYPHPTLGFAVSVLVLGFFTLVVVIDIEHRLILHPISIVGGILGLVVGSMLHGITATVLGGVAGYGFMLAIYLLGILFVRILSRKRGPINEVALGYGDVNLGGVVGFILGWPGIIGGLLITILLAGAVSLIYMLAMLVAGKFRPNMALPFGPYLVSSVILLLFLAEYFRDFF